MGQYLQNTQAIEALDHRVARQESGDMHYSFVTTANLGAETGDQIQLHFTTPDTVDDFHCEIYLQASGEVLFTVREAPTGGLVGGSSATMLCYNRRNPLTNPLSAVTTAASAGTGGTLILQEYAGSGRIAAAQRAAWTLKRNTTYAFRIYDTTTSVTATLLVEWYTHV